MKVNYNELEKQRREEIIKNDKYIRAEIIVQTVDEKKSGNFMPVSTVEIHNSNSLTLWAIIKSLRVAADSLEEEHPEVKLVDVMYGAKLINSKMVNSKDMLEVEDDE